MNNEEIKKRAQQILNHIFNAAFVYNAENAQLMEELKYLQSICDHNGQENVCEYCKKELDNE